MGQTLAQVSLIWHCCHQRHPSHVHTSRGRRDLEKRSTASVPVTNPSRSESYVGKIDSYLDLSWPDMAYWSAPTRGSCATKAPPESAKPCETDPDGGGGTFCILASGREDVRSSANRSAEIGTPGDAWKTEHEINKGKD